MKQGSIGVLANVAINCFLGNSACKQSNSFNLIYNAENWRMRLVTSTGTTTLEEGDEILALVDDPAHEQLAKLLSRPK